MQYGKHMLQNLTRLPTAFIIALTALAYVAMVTVNALATILPINNRTTGEISDSYPNIFAPAGITFSIWGVIYLLLGAYVVYQVVQLFTSKKPRSTQATQIQLFFALSSVINIAWIFAWHYDWIGVSVLLMLGLLATLITIADLTKTAQLPAREQMLTKIAFGVYFGWITIATIANITTYLVKLGWNGLGLPDAFWMILVLLVSVIISVWRTWKDRNLAYGLVPVWAYGGIWLKHTSPQGFDAQYPSVIAAVMVCLVVLVISNGALLLRSGSKERQ
jgi:hypothetical protein